MLSFLKENGFPMTIHFETSKFEDQKEDFHGWESIVTDANGKELGRFTHSVYHDRAYWANGFFTGLKLKNGT
jgi:hypothetical protein